MRVAIMSQSTRREVKYMFGLGRRKKKADKTSVAGTADTFLEATGGGWNDAPDIIAADGGEYAEFVGQILAGARRYADEHVEIDGAFIHTISDIPRGIASPHEIMFGVMMRALDYDLRCEGIFNETVHFRRLR